MKRPECYATREQWLAARSTFLGASEAAAILGVSPHAGRFSIYLHKIGELPSDDESESMAWGRQMESLVLDAYADRFERAVRNRRKQFHVYRAKGHPMIAATLDAVQDDQERGPGVVEAKLVSEGNRWQWAKGPPLHYQVQMQHQLLATGLPWGTVVALHGNLELEKYDIDADPRFQRVLIAELRAFWGYIERRESPPIDNTLDTLEAINRKFPTDAGTEIVLPLEASRWDAKLRKAKRLIKRLEGVARECESQIKNEMGDAAVGVLPDGGASYTWRMERRHLSAREERDILFRRFARKKGR